MIRNGTQTTDDPSTNLVAQIELFEVAADLELLKDLDVVEQLDVLEDLDVIAALDTEGS